MRQVLLCGVSRRGVEDVCVCRVLVSCRVAVSKPAIRLFRVLRTLIVMLCNGVGTYSRYGCRQTTSPQKNELQLFALHCCSHFFSFLSSFVMECKLQVAQLLYYYIFFWASSWLLAWYSKKAPAVMPSPVFLSFQLCFWPKKQLATCNRIISSSSQGMYYQTLKKAI